MNVARALSFDVPSSSIIPFDESLVCARDVDEDIEIKELLIDPYPEIEQIEKSFDQCFESFVEPYPENEQIEELLDQCFESFVGMELDSIDAAYKFYNNYRFKTGFSIGKAQKYHSQIGEKKIISQRFICSNEGLSKRQKQERVGVNEKTPQKTISFWRIDCKALMSISLQLNGKWLVSTFRKEHNHEMVQSPSKKRYLKSHAHIRNDQKECITILSNQNVAPAKIYEAIIEKEGGRQNVHFSKKYLSNEIAKENKKLVGMDVKKSLEYFKTMQERDPNFFFEIEPDNTFSRY